MAYDYPNPRRCGYVEDISYNDGTVKRTILDTGEVLYLNEEKEPEFELLKQFKKEYNMGKIIQFPTLFHKERIGSKYRIKELELLREYLRTM